MSGGKEIIHENEEEEMFVDESQEQPLLDTALYIERPSHMWAEDPVSDSEVSETLNKSK
jgi:hypothetical protein